MVKQVVYFLLRQMLKLNQFLLLLNHLPLHYLMVKLGILLFLHLLM
jgi:hypothetical protein